MTILNMRTKISFHRNENKYIKVRLVKSSFGGLRNPVDRTILFLFLVSSKDVYTRPYVLGFFNQGYDFSRKSLFKILNGGDRFQ